MQNIYKIATPEQILVAVAGSKGTRKGTQESPPTSKRHFLTEEGEIPWLWLQQRHVLQDGMIWRSLL